MRSPEADHSSSEALNLFVLFDQAPVKPAHLFILAVSIIVAALGSATLVAAEQHGNSSRDKQGQYKILNQSVPHPFDDGIVARPFHAAIVAVVGIGSIAVVLAIFVIVLLLVADQIVQREPIMRSYEVEAACRSLARASVQI